MTTSQVFGNVQYCTLIIYVQMPDTLVRSCHVGVAAATECFRAGGARRSCSVLVWWGERGCFPSLVLWALLCNAFHISSIYPRLSIAFHLLHLKHCAVAFLASYIAPLLVRERSACCRSAYFRFTVEYPSTQVVGVAGGFHEVHTSCFENNRCPVKLPANPVQF